VERKYLEQSALEILRLAGGALGWRWSPAILTANYGTT
jgi:hypothetical protein